MVVVSVYYSYMNEAFEICFSVPNHNVKLECHPVNTTGNGRRFRISG